MLFLRCGRLDVEGGALVLVDEQGVRVQIPAGGVACLLLEPGVTLTHAAVVLAADCGTLLLWVGEAGVRLYSAGQPGRGAFRQIALPGPAGPGGRPASAGGAGHVSLSFRGGTACPAQRGATAGH